MAGGEGVCGCWLMKAMMMMMMMMGEVPMIDSILPTVDVGWPWWEKGIRGGTGSFSLIYLTVEERCKGQLVLWSEQPTPGIS